MSILDETSLTIESIFNIDAAKVGFKPPSSLKNLLLEQTELACDALGLHSADSMLFQSDAELQELLSEIEFTGYLIEAWMPMAKGFEFDGDELIGYSHDLSNYKIQLFSGDSVEECLEKATHWHNKNIADWSAASLTE
ncbi:hypothetical protein [Photobacterium galatheae]|uniref:hypothetical protein n=1 Tax=Photobacterium galatheae TaxID=1654360 RepID=UPI0012690D0C|nr:hypothetical protein [Photobacterium galatheae]MCM0149048.1 hypothetical protein [Photobacterium galatheae]